MEDREKIQVLINEGLKRFEINIQKLKELELDLNIN